MAHALTVDGAAPVPEDDAPGAAALRPATAPRAAAARPLRAPAPAPRPLAPTQRLEEALLQLTGEFGLQGGYYVHLGHAVRDHRACAGREAVRFVATSVSDRRLYLEEGGLAFDPAADGVAQARLPLVWVVAPEREPDEGRRRLLSRLRGRGVAGGVSIPVQDYAAGPAYLSLYSAFRGDPERLVRHRGPDLAYAATRFHEAVMAQLPPRSGEHRALTGREIECLRLAALGLTVPETAEALSVAARTVEFHLKNAAEKFGAPNKLRAVALAIGLGLIAT